jgi:hypothetical protein
MIVSLNTSIEVSGLRHRVRRLNWFRQSFKDRAVALGERYGWDFAIDDRALASAFLNWAEAFARERADAQRDRRDFVIYSGGMMLRELLRAQPVRSFRNNIETPVMADATVVICDFWPQGFLYVNYCETIVRSILENDFSITIAVDPRYEDLRTWESFRENVGQDPSLAVPFFDVLFGGAPNWVWPYSFLSRLSAQEAGRLVAPTGG